jgi:hypothetical protein
MSDPGKVYAIKATLAFPGEDKYTLFRISLLSALDSVNFFDISRQKRIRAI